MTNNIHVPETWRTPSEPKHPLWSTSKETRLADQVFELMSRGRRQEADTLLREQGFEDAKWQLDLIAGFLRKTKRHSKYHTVIRW